MLDEAARHNQYPFGVELVSLTLTRETCTISALPLGISARDREEIRKGGPARAIAQQDLGGLFRS